MTDSPRYMISVAADLVMHPQTLRMYESRGLVRPCPHPGRHPPVPTATSTGCA